jgi:hypothetical protein
VGASAASIRTTYETVLRWIQREEAEVPAEELILAPVVALVSAG